MNYVRSYSLSLKYQGFPPSDSQDIGIKKFEFVAKSQFLSFPFSVAYANSEVTHVEHKEKSQLDIINF